MVRRLVDRLRAWPWGRIALGALGLALFVVVVPPARQFALMTASRAVLLAASPLTPDVGDFDRLPATTRVVAGDGTLLAELDGPQRRDPVTVDSLPDHVVRAVLAAEDANFYDHDGIDPGAVFRATLRSAQGRQQGGSTITQQLAKINYTDGERTVFRKLKELLYAVELEKRYTKNELIERYLNQVYFGDGAYGIAAAAESYFGVTPQQLTPAQAATLAGMIRSPEGLDPRAKPEPVQARRGQVLAAMDRHGWLDGGAARQASASPLGVVPRQAPSGRKAPQFVEYVIREAAGIDALGGTPEGRRHQLVTGGYTVETTLDTKAYDAAEAATRERLGAPGDPSVSVVSVQPGDGAIRNFFDGLDPNRQFDVASLGHRQPGSAFKPFVYLAALGHGIDPRSEFEAASPMTLHSPLVGDFEVNNYEGRGQGLTTVDAAMASSINTVYSQLALEVGPANVIRTATRAGITADIKPFPSVALGGLSDGVSPLQMATAYATFAANGTHAHPYAIARIRDARGQIVYTHTPQTSAVFPAAEIGVLNNAMQRVVEMGTGRAARLDRPVAGKTGTTQDYGDAWFTGYVPQLATAVWVGHPDKVVPMRNVHGVDGVTGGSFPAEIFAATMRRALEGVPVQPLPTAAPDQLALVIMKPIPPTTLPPTTLPPAVGPPGSVVAVVQTSPQSGTPRYASTTTTTAPAPATTTTTRPPQQQQDPAPTTTTTTPQGRPDKKPGRD